MKEKLFLFAQDNIRGKKWGILILFNPLNLSLALLLMLQTEHFDVPLTCFILHFHLFIRPNDLGLDSTANMKGLLAAIEVARYA